MDSSVVEGYASLRSRGTDATNRRVSYFFGSSIGEYYYGQGRLMKPHRIRIAYNLLCNYNLHQKMEIIELFPANREDIGWFNSLDYVEFLSSVSPETLYDKYEINQLKRFNVRSECLDCPVFYGLFDFCQALAGGSIGASVKLNRKDADTAINWAGGLHHAKKSEASGFCYVNDIVRGILELLKVHKTAVAVGVEPDNDLPCNEFYGYFALDFSLSHEALPMENKNAPWELKKISRWVPGTLLLEQLSRLPHVPSVLFQVTPSITEVPEEREKDMDQRPKPGIRMSQDYDTDVEEKSNKGKFSNYSNREN